MFSASGIKNIEFHSYSQKLRVWSAELDFINFGKIITVGEYFDDFFIICFFTTKVLIEKTKLVWY